MSRACIPAPDDWRRRGQERYLRGAMLFAREYRPYRIGWEHDHCEFCGAKFSYLEGELRSGYTTDDGYHWICTQCFNDFRVEFGWRVDGEAKRGDGGGSSGGSSGTSTSRE